MKYERLDLSQPLIILPKETISWHQRFAKIVFSLKPIYLYIFIHNFHVGYTVRLSIQPCINFIKSQGKDISHIIF